MYGTDFFLTRTRPEIDWKYIYCENREIQSANLYEAKSSKMPIQKRSCERQKASTELDARRRVSKENFAVTSCVLRPHGLGNTTARSESRERENRSIMLRPKSERPDPSAPSEMPECHLAMLRTN